MKVKLYAEIVCVQSSVNSTFNMLGTLLLAAIVLFYFYVRKKLQFFKNHGVPHDPGYFPFGSIVTIKALMGQVPFLQISEEVYKKYPQHRVVGYYGLFGKPILVIRDLEIAKKVLIKDFDHFMDRAFDGENAHPESNKHFRNMVSALKGQKWKAMRNMLTPIFTSGKIKATLPLVNEAASALSQHFQTLVHQESIDVKEEFQKFTAEVLGKLGCGIEPKVFGGEDNNYFYEMAQILTGSGKPNLKQAITFMLFQIAPLLLYFFKASLIDARVMAFFEGVIRQTIKERKESKAKKNDFIDLLTEAIEEGEAGSNNLKAAFPDAEIEDIIISNAIVLFFAGFDTTSSGLSISSLFLAKNPDIQERLYQEIKEAIDENDGDPNLGYAKLQSLRLLDSVIKESLRLWGFNFFDRTCTKAYRMSEVNFTVPEGMQVQIGGAGIMREEKYYKRAEVFDPEAHFEDDSLYPPSFMAFGQGPRNCIGMRFAYTMIRAALVHTLAKYQFVPNSKTINDFVIDPLSSSVLPKGGIHFRLKAREEL